MRIVAAVAVALIAGTVCSPPPGGTPFDLAVAPAEEPVALRTAIPGQRSIFLVSAPDETDAEGPIAITATAPGAEIVVEPAMLAANKVVEVTVTPEPTEAEDVVAVTITGTRNGVIRSVLRTLPIVPEIDGRAEDAAVYRELFVRWLGETHPELGIGPATAWQGTIAGAHLLVVMHYLYLTPEWELMVEWHVMIAPYDWATMYLRRRFTESRPSFAAKIDSVSAASGIYEVAPPTEVRR